MFDLWSPKLGLCGTSIPAGRCSQTLNKSAEIPSFGENQIGNPILTAQAQEAVTYEIGTRDGERTTPGSRRLPRQHRPRAAVPQRQPRLVLPGGERQRDRSSGHRGGIPRRRLEVDRHGQEPRQAVAQHGLHVQRLPLRPRPGLRRQPDPGRAAALPALRALYKHPSGIYFGPDIEWVPEAYYVDNANTFKSAGYAIWGAKAGFDNGGSGEPTSKAATYPTRPTSPPRISS